MSKILVTGGAGYIGSHFCLAAQKAGHQVVCYDNLSRGHKKFVRFGPLVKGDLANKNLLIKTLKKYKIEAVVHFAALALVGESMAKPEKYYANNVAGSLSLLQAMLAAKVKTIVFSSSAATYGAPAVKTIKENQAQKPINPYGWSKKMVEQMILDWQRSYGFKTVILRYFNVIGQDGENRVWEDHRPETHLVPNIIKALKNQTPFFLFGNNYPTPDKSCVRDYVDVNDLAQVHLAALKYLKNHDFLISNVGRGRGYSNKEIVAAIEKVFGAKIKIQIKPRRAGDPARLVASNKFFKSWCPVKIRSLEQSLSNIKNNLK